MKLLIEINDDTLNHAIEQQLSAVVAQQVGKQIDAIVDGVLNKKLERFTDEVLSNRIELAARKMLLESIGKQGWPQVSSLKSYLEQAAIKLLREQMK